MIAALLLSSCPAGAGDDGPWKRLFYQISVTAPGTRNQGWYGTLYDRTVGIVTVRPGAVLRTDLGEFVSVECTIAWAPCGVVELGMLAWVAETLDDPVIMDRKRWEYRLFVSDEHSNSPRLWGEIVHGEDAVSPPRDGQLSTPIGAFTWFPARGSGRNHGWIHRSWGAFERPASESAVRATWEAAQESLKKLRSKIKLQLEAPEQHREATKGG